jgi:4'-phosphopantetheinyl transferase
MEVHWLEQRLADVPGGDDWLGTAERIRESGMRFAKRRADWRLGRWTAKRAVAACLRLSGDAHSLADIEIRAAASGAPEVWVATAPAAVTISLSHRAGVAACAVAGPGVALGCDLEIIEPRSHAFAADYFTAAEQALVAEASAADRPAILALVWSAKESVLKALRLGLRLDTRSVAVHLLSALPPGGGNGWRPLTAGPEGQVFRGWWQRSGPLLRTLVAAPAPDLPLDCPVH